MWLELFVLRSWEQIFSNGKPVARSTAQAENEPDKKGEVLR
jgi:hypothetical protein